MSVHGTLIMNAIGVAKHTPNMDPMTIVGIVGNVQDAVNVFVTISVPIAENMIASAADTTMIGTKNTVQAVTIAIIATIAGHIALANH